MATTIKDNAQYEIGKWFSPIETNNFEFINTELNQALGSSYYTDDQDKSSNDVARAQVVSISGRNLTEVIGHFERAELVLFSTPPDQIKNASYNLLQNIESLQIQIASLSQYSDESSKATVKNLKAQVAALEKQAGLIDLAEVTHDLRVTLQKNTQGEYELKDSNAGTVVPTNGNQKVLSAAAQSGSVFAGGAGAYFLKDGVRGALKADGTRFSAHDILTELNSQLSSSSSSSSSSSVTLSFRQQTTGPVMIDALTGTGQISEQKDAFFHLLARTDLVDDGMLVTNNPVDFNNFTVTFKDKATAQAFVDNLFGTKDKANLTQFGGTELGTNRKLQTWRVFGLNLGGGTQDDVFLDPSSFHAFREKFITTTQNVIPKEEEYAYASIIFTNLQLNLSTAPQNDMPGATILMPLLVNEDGAIVPCPEFDERGELKKLNDGSEINQILRSHEDIKAYKIPAGWRLPTPKELQDFIHVSRKFGGYSIWPTSDYYVLGQTSHSNPMPFLQVWLTDQQPSSQGLPTLAVTTNSVDASEVTNKISMRFSHHELLSLLKILGISSLEPAAYNKPLVVSRTLVPGDEDNPSIIFSEQNRELNMVYEIDVTVNQLRDARDELKRALDALQYYRDESVVELFYTNPNSVDEFFIASRAHLQGKTNPLPDLKKATTIQIKGQDHSKTLIEWFVWELALEMMIDQAVYRDQSVDEHKWVSLESMEYKNFLERNWANFAIPGALIGLATTVLYVWFIQDNQKKALKAQADIGKGDSPKEGWAQFGRDITAEIRDNPDYEYGKITGRDDLVTDIIKGFDAPPGQPSSVSIEGPPGAGKSWLAQAVAERFADPKQQYLVPQNLQGSRVLELDVPSLMASTKFRGQFEEKMMKMLAELLANDFAQLSAYDMRQCRLALEEIASVMKDLKSHGYNGDGSLNISDEELAKVQKRMKKIFERYGDIVSRNPHLKTILIIDEVHMTVSAGKTEGGGINFWDILKPYLADGRINLLVMSTDEEIKILFQDQAIERRFRRLRLNELSREEINKVTKKMIERHLDHAKKDFETKHIPLVFSETPEFQQFLDTLYDRAIYYASGARPASTNAVLKNFLADAQREFKEISYVNSALNDARTKREGIALNLGVKLDVLEENQRLLDKIEARQKLPSFGERAVASVKILLRHPAPLILSWIRRSKPGQDLIPVGLKFDYESIEFEVEFKMLAARLVEKNIITPSDSEKDLAAPVEADEYVDWLVKKTIKQMKMSWKDLPSDKKTSEELQKIKQAAEIVFMETLLKNSGETSTVSTLDGEKRTGLDAIERDSSLSDDQKNQARQKIELEYSQKLRQKLSLPITVEALNSYLESQNSPRVNELLGHIRSEIAEIVKTHGIDAADLGFDKATLKIQSGESFESHSTRLDRILYHLQIAKMALAQDKFATDNFDGQSFSKTDLIKLSVKKALSTGSTDEGSVKQLAAISSLTSDKGYEALQIKEGLPPPTAAAGAPTTTAGPIQPAAVGTPSPPSAPATPSTATGAPTVDYTAQIQDLVAKNPDRFSFETNGDLKVIDTKKLSGAANPRNVKIPVADLTTQAELIHDLLVLTQTQSSYQHFRTNYDQAKTLCGKGATVKDVIEFFTDVTDHAQRTGVTTAQELTDHFTKKAAVQAAAQAVAASQPGGVQTSMGLAALAPFLPDALVDEAANNHDFVLSGEAANNNNFEQRPLAPAYQNLVSEISYLISIVGFTPEQIKAQLVAEGVTGVRYDFVDKVLDSLEKDGFFQAWAAQKAAQEVADALAKQEAADAAETQNSTDAASTQPAPTDKIKQLVNILRDAKFSPAEILENIKKTEGSHAALQAAHVLAQTDLDPQAHLLISFKALVSSGDVDPGLLGATIARLAKQYDYDRVALLEIHQQLSQPEGITTSFIDNFRGTGMASQLGMGLFMIGAAYVECWQVNPSNSEALLDLVHVLPQLLLGFGAQSVAGAAIESVTQRLLIEGMRISTPYGMAILGGKNLSKAGLVINPSYAQAFVKGLPKVLTKGLNIIPGVGIALSSVGGKYLEVYVLDDITMKQMEWYGKSGNQALEYFVEQHHVATYHKALINGAAGVGGWAAGAGIAAATGLTGGSALLVVLATSLVVGGAGTAWGEQAYDDHYAINKEEQYARALQEEFSKAGVGLDVQKSQYSDWIEKMRATSPDYFVQKYMHTFDLLNTKIGDIPEIMRHASDSNDVELAATLNDWKNQTILQIFSGHDLSFDLQSFHVETLLALVLARARFPHEKSHLKLSPVENISADANGTLVFYDIVTTLENGLVERTKLQIVYPSEHAMAFAAASQAHQESLSQQENSLLSNLTRVEAQDYSLATLSEFIQKREEAFHLDKEEIARHTIDNSKFEPLFLDRAGVEKLLFSSDGKEWLRTAGRELVELFDVSKKMQKFIDAHYAIQNTEDGFVINNDERQVLIDFLYQNLMLAYHDFYPDTSATAPLITVEFLSQLHHAHQKVRSQKDNISLTRQLDDLKNTWLRNRTQTIYKNDTHTVLNQALQSSDDWHVFQAFVAVRDGLIKTNPSLQAKLQGFMADAGYTFDDLNLVSEATWSDDGLGVFDGQTFLRLTQQDRDFCREIVLWIAEDHVTLQKYQNLYQNSLQEKNNDMIQMAINQTQELGYATYAAAMTQKQSQDENAIAQLICEDVTVEMPVGITDKQMIAIWQNVWAERLAVVALDTFFKTGTLLSAQKTSLRHLMADYGVVIDSSKPEEEKIFDQLFSLTAKKFKELDYSGVVKILESSQWLGLSAQHEKLDYLLEEVIFMNYQYVAEKKLIPQLAQMTQQSQTAQAGSKYAVAVEAKSFNDLSLQELEKLAGFFSVTNDTDEGLGAFFDIAPDMIAELMAHNPGLASYLQRKTGGVVSVSGSPIYLDFSAFPEQEQAFLKNMQIIWTGVYLRDVISQRKKAIAKQQQEIQRLDDWQMTFETLYDLALSQESQDDMAFGLARDLEDLGVLNSVDDNSIKSFVDLILPRILLVIYESGVDTSSAPECEEAILFALTGYEKLALEQSGFELPKNVLDELIVAVSKSRMTYEDVMQSLS